jgi:hypothetical protein
VSTRCWSRCLSLWCCHDRDGEDRRGRDRLSRTADVLATGLCRYRRTTRRRAVAGRSNGGRSESRVSSPCCSSVCRSPAATRVASWSSISVNRSTSLVSRATNPCTIIAARPARHVLKLAGTSGPTAGPVQGRSPTHARLPRCPRPAQSRISRGGASGLTDSTGRPEDRGPTRTIEPDGRANRRVDQRYLTEQELCSPSCDLWPQRLGDLAGRRRLSRLPSTGSAAHHPTGPAGRLPWRIVGPVGSVITNRHRIAVPQVRKVETHPEIGVVALRLLRGDGFYRGVYVELAGAPIVVRNIACVVVYASVVCQACDDLLLGQRR